MRQFTTQIDRTADEASDGLLDVTVYVRQGLIDTVEYNGKEIDTTEAENERLYETYWEMKAAGDFQPCYKEYR